MRLNLKPIRVNAGFTQAQLAEESGVEQASISRWETGESMPGVDKLIKLAKILNCSIDDFFKPDQPDTAKTAS